jgi:NAD(P)-dependent dehydrogenase (short-subunit alcohol dehydrogenase family)
MFSLKNKKTIITGGGSGIGRATSILFGKQGAIVCVVDINQDQVEETTRLIKGEGGEAYGYMCDVTVQADVINLYKEIGTIDILINSAGISHIGKADTTTEEEFDQVFKVNVKGVYNSLHAALGIMKQQGSGIILNLSSVAAVVGLADRFSYSMSKGAVYAMTMSVAKDYIGYNIRCNCVSPGRVHTPFVDNFLSKNYPGKEEEMFEKLSKTQPIGRMATPKEIGYLILYLCSDEASFITGSDYNIDGGFIKLNS